MVLQCLKAILNLNFFSTNCHSMMKLEMGGEAIFGMLYLCHQEYGMFQYSYIKLALTSNRRAAAFHFSLCERNLPFCLWRSLILSLRSAHLRNSPTVACDFLDLSFGLAWVDLLIAMPSLVSEGRLSSSDKSSPELVEELLPPFSTSQSPHASTALALEPASPSAPHSDSRLASLSISGKYYNCL